MRHKVWLATLLIAASFHTSAQTPAKPASVERLIEAAQMSKMVDTMAAQVPQLAQGMAQQMGIKPSDQTQFDAYMKSVMEALSDEVTWARMKGPMVEIYLRHYSEEEVQGMITFYESPVGRSMLEKAPAVARDSAQMSQQIFARMIPRIQALAKEMKAKQKTNRQEAASPAAADEKK